MCKKEIDWEERMYDTSRKILIELLYNRVETDVKRAIQYSSSLIRELKAYNEENFSNQNNNIENG